jgi:hypothetical protein
MIKKCVNCGIEFETCYSQQKYCSPSCFTETYKRKNERKKAERKDKRTESTCLWCHSKFKTIFLKQKYCDGECRDQYNRMKQKIFKLHPFEDTSELRKELEEKGKNFVLR